MRCRRAILLCFILIIFTASRVNCDTGNTYEAEPRIKKQHREELDGLWLHGVFQEDIFRPSQVLVELNRIRIKTLRWNNTLTPELNCIYIKTRRWNNASTPEDNKTKTGAG